MMEIYICTWDVEGIEGPRAQQGRYGHFVGRMLLKEGIFDLFGILAEVGRETDGEKAAGTEASDMKVSGAGAYCVDTSGAEVAGAETSVVEAAGAKVSGAETYCVEAPGAKIGMMPAYGGLGAVGEEAAAGIGIEVLLAYGDNGKPYVKGRPDIHFNISHCPGAAVCVFADSPVGADIENAARHMTDAAVRRVMTEGELGLLSGYRPDDNVVGDMELARVQAKGQDRVRTGTWAVPQGMAQAGERTSAQAGAEAAVKKTKAQAGIRARAQDEAQAGIRDRAQDAVHISGSPTHDVAHVTDSPMQAIPAGGGAAQEKPCTLQGKYDELCIRLWTLKESRAKYDGTGITGAFCCYGFTLDPEDISAPITSTEGGLHFEQYIISGSGNRFILSICTGPDSNVAGEAAVFHYRMGGLSYGK